MLVPSILTFTLVLVGFALMLLVGWAAWRHRNSSLQAAGIPGVEPEPSSTNRWVAGLRGLLLLALILILGFHSYWVYWADSSEEFSRARQLDARNRRLAEGGLKGWVLDRSGRFERALIRYRADGPLVTREYPLGASGVHLTGYSDFVFGAGGIEHGFRAWLTEPTSIRNQLASAIPVGKDIRVSVDSELQRYVAGLLEGAGRPAAAVVLLTPGNEVLTMASSPGFDPFEVKDEASWRRLSEQAETAQLLSPFVNRALGTLVTGGPSYTYRPGSTFKIFVAAVAIDSGFNQERFTCQAEGFTPPGSRRPIRDFAGQVHGTLDLPDAFRVSCNQYFAQLGLKLGRERLANYARRIRFAISPDERNVRAPDYWAQLRGNRRDFDFIFAPPISRLNLSSEVTPYDIALQSIGQGYADMTPFGLALLAAAAVHSEGMFTEATLETGINQPGRGRFVNPQTANQLRKLMRLVVESGTASGAFSNRSPGSAAGGKTGTADRDVPAYDALGKRIIESTGEDGRPRYGTAHWTDSWFVGFAPWDNPRIVCAVLVENGGPGSATAAPVAAKVMEKAALLGYLNGPGVTMSNSKAGRK